MIKRIAKCVLGRICNGKYLFLFRQYKRYIRASRTTSEKIVFLLNGIFHGKSFNASSRGRSFYRMMKSLSIKPVNNSLFFYNIDVFKQWFTDKRVMANCTVDYGEFIHTPLHDYKISTDSDNPFFSSELVLVKTGLEEYLDRIIAYVKKHDMPNKTQILESLQNIYSGSAKNLEDALQRILFLNQVMWQTGHELVGLGRLDLILDEFVTDDVTDEELKHVLSEFYKCLHSYYWHKSSALMGDTGQIIVLGGKMKDGSYFCNRVTKSFIDVAADLQLPDPKVLLRVSNETPDFIWNDALSCIATGIGCPLLSNDEVVIPDMIQFGYEEDDAYNYVTSACWEPLVPGISHEQNNIELINYTMPLDFLSDMGRMRYCNSFEKLLIAYEEQLTQCADFVRSHLDEIKWERDPFLSFVTSSCRESNCDISLGGGKYNNYGVLTVAMGNAINSLMNIKKYVFEKELYTLEEFDRHRRANYTDAPELLAMLKEEYKYYGSDDSETIELVNRLTNTLSDAFSDYRNTFGGKIKFGFSSPSYLDAGKNSPASFDGRQFGAPYSVHISNDGGIAYTELFNFAAQLEYNGRRFNGNVVDYFISPTILNDARDKIVTLLKCAFEKGVFQMQLNVVNSKTLIAARENPDQYANLIVRVWGFSAYFVQLPEEYQLYLIERALICEKGH